MDSILLKIKDLQKKHGFTTKDISKEIGVTSQTLYDYFSGKTQISIKNLQKLADVFKVPMTYFFEEEFASNCKDEVKNLKKENEKLKTKLAEKERVNLFYWEFTESLYNNITDLFVKIVTNTPKMKDFMNKQEETKRIINRINTLEAFSEMKVIINRDFFKYFKSTFEK